MVDRQDNELVRRCLRGETSAFEMLVDKYQKPIYNLAFRMTKNFEDAEDLTQTVFIKAFQKLDSFRFNYKFFSWIYRIAVNESLNFLNQRRRLTDLDSKIISTEKTPEEIVHEEELNRQIQDGLMVLNPDYRILIILKHFHAFSYREISFIVDIPEKKVKSRLFTARQLLKDALMEKGLKRHG